jgi:hypothetical protein
MHDVGYLTRADLEEEDLDNSVVVLAWPEEAERFANLAPTGQPLLLLVSADAEPPSHWGRLTDWVRLPVDDRDFLARVAALQRRAVRLPAPTLDEYDVLWRGPLWSALAPIEARLFEVLLERRGTVVSRRDLGQAAWPKGMPTERAVDARLSKLRKRIEPLGLHIHNVRRRGLRLDISDPPEPAVL